MKTDEILVAADIGLVIRSVEDVAEAVGATFDKGGLSLSESDLSPAFFDLRSGLAGELFSLSVGNAGDPQLAMAR